MMLEVFSSKYTSVFLAVGCIECKRAGICLYGCLRFKENQKQNKKPQQQMNNKTRNVAWQPQESCSIIH